MQAGSLFIWSMLLSPTRGLYYAVPTNPNQVLQATLQQLSRCSSGNNARHISTMYAKLAHLSSTQWLKITKKGLHFNIHGRTLLLNFRPFIEVYFECVSLAKKKRFLLSIFGVKIQMNVARFARNMWQNATFLSDFPTLVMRAKSFG